MLVLTSANANHNKFYELILHDDGMIDTRWGRVGANGQSKVISGGKPMFERKLSEKRAKGYRDVQTVGQVARSSRRAGTADVRAGLTDSSDPRVSKLIARIVAVNAHDILAKSGGRITYTDGVLRTPLGIIGIPALDEAERILKDIRNASSRRLQIPLLEELLTLVPQKVGARAGWENELLTPSALDHQAVFIAQLRDSVRFADKQQSTQQEDSNIRFAYKLDVVDPASSEFARVSEAFRDSSNSKHMSSAYHLAALYSLTSDAATHEAYVQKSKEMGNRGTYWHGTSAANILSILATGLRTTSSATNGRMFGDGIYLSNQSTKSLNYSTGVWNGSARGGAFMFSARAVKGKVYHPSSWTTNWKKVYASGYNSVEVMPGTAGVRNHELVIPDSDRVNLRYLCEFER